MAELTAGVTSIADLADLLTGQLLLVYRLSPDRPRGQQELTCAQDVAEALREITRPRPGEFVPPPAIGNWFYPPSVVPLIDIPVIVSQDSAPGTWRLVTHDYCEVRNADDIERARVSHQNCTITAEGRLQVVAAGHTAATCTASPPTGGGWRAAASSTCAPGALPSGA